MLTISSVGHNELYWINIALYIAIVGDIVIFKSTVNRLLA